MPLSTCEDLVEIPLHARDGRELLDRINVHVNGVPCFGMRGQSLRDLESSDHRTTLAVELGVGENRIDVSVHNVKGVESLRETLHVVREAAGRRPSMYVLAVGVSRYGDSEYDLDFAARDADALADVLERHGGAFETVSTRVLTDSEATREAILTARSFLEAARVDDVVVVFVAGHGLVDSRLDYYFATADVDFLDPAGKGLSYSDLERLLDGIPARRRVLLMDTCLSGELDREDSRWIAAGTMDPRVRVRSFRGVTVARRSPAVEGLGLANSFDLVRHLFVDLRQTTGANVIAASSGDQVSIESEEWGSGVFTYALREGLDSGRADGDGDGAIFVSELREYVVARVQELTGGLQTPTDRGINPSTDFRLR